MEKEGPAVRILGPLEVAVAGTIVDLGRPKQRAVLAILVVHANRTVSLEYLVDELWGDDPPAHAIGSLQAYVSHLRRLLEPGRPARTPARVLVSQAPGYRLVVADDELDAARFERRASVARKLLADGEAGRAVAELDGALALWRGDVLADFADAKFARAERARLAEVRLAAVEDRVTAELTLGRPAVVGPELERLVGAHPYRESLHGLRMLALYRAGRQADALAAYRHARTVLGDELGIAPGPQLETLHRQILGQAPELDRPPPVRAEVVVEPPAEPERPLVGRDGPLAALERALAETVAGRGRTVLVGGEPGVGKTRLAEELVRRARGLAVGWGRCDEEPGAPPFWPWTQVLRGLLADLPPAGPLPAEVAALLDETPEPALPVVDVEVVRFRLSRAIADVLRRLAAVRPLVIVIDDVQWADAGSLRLLPVLAGEPAPILVLTTYRDADPGPSGALGDTHAALARLPAVDRITLDGLSEADVRHLMAAELGREPDDDVARVVHDRSGGNPFFVVELVRLLGRAGADEVPAGVRDVLRRRLARLPEQTRAVLLLASVVGRDFDLDVVRDVSGLDDEAALDAVEAALLSGLLVESGTAGRFRFAHAIVREAIYHEVSRARRARLHARVAEALDARPAAAGPHWWLAAPVVGVRTAVPHLLAAADHAMDTLAHEAAERHLGHALELIAAGPRSADLIRYELDAHMRLATLHAQLHGAWSGAGRAAVTKARELAEELGDSAATIAVHRGMYEVAVARAEHTEAADLAVRMLAAAERLADPEPLGLAHLAVGRTAWCRGEPARAFEHLSRSLALAVAGPDQPHRPQEALPVDVTVRLQLAPVLDLIGRPADASAHVDTAIAQARDKPALIRAGVFTSAALIAGLRRDVDAAGAHAARALDLAGPLPAWFSYASAVRSWVAAMRGDALSAVAELRETLDGMQSRGARHLVAWVLGLLAEAELLAGRPTEALTVLDDALERVTTTGERAYEAELHRLRGTALLAASPTAAGDAFRMAVDVAHRQGAVLLEARATSDLPHL